MTDAAEMFSPLPRANGAIPGAPAEAPEWLPEVPAPEAPPAEAFHHRRHGTPTMTWLYRDAAGRVLFAVARFDPPDGKEVLPLTYGSLRGRRGWHWRAPPRPAPLYGLPDLAARPDAPVVVVEGEKTAEAAAALFPDHVAVTWQGGTNATGKADWTPLHGRRMAVWPDNDTPGRKAAAEVEAACRAAAAASVAVVQIPEGWPAKWDVADAPPPGTTADTLRRILAEAEREARGAASLPPGFRLTSEGLFFAPPEDADASPLHVCGPLRIVARTNDGTGHAWGALLEWKDADGHRHEWAMPNAMLAGDGQEVRARLMDGGLFVAHGPRARARLAEYLTRAAPAERVRVVPRIGWHRIGGTRAFVLPDRTLGAEEGGRVMLQTDRPETLPPLALSGTLAEWRDDIAAHAPGNSRLALVLCAALAAPLAGLVNAEGGGFHLRGGSSLGKTTALRVAGSVWGGGGLHGWLRSWRTTDNALEAVAAAHCDLLLCLDEIGEASPETVAACAYALANGAGKGRAARDGSARRVAEWRVLFLSTGEEGLADRLAEARGGARRVRAGQEVRVLDIPAEAGPLGLFNDLGGFPSAAALAEHLTAAAGRLHGSAGLAWLERLAADPDGAARRAREVMAAFMADHLPGDAAGQVRRAANRFALVAAAGEMAAGWGILPWNPEVASNAAAACFDAWRGARAGGDGAAEDAAALAAVAAFIGAHGESRFQVVTDHRAKGAFGTPDPVAPDAEADARPIINRAGWRKRDGDGWRYCVLPETWKREVVAGLDPEAAARALRRAGHLVAANGGEARNTRMERVGLGKPARVYVIRDSILTGEEAKGRPHDGAG